jgi:hypothetical protein
MKTNIAEYIGYGTVIAIGLAILCLFIVRPALALVDATSSPLVAGTSSPIVSLTGGADSSASTTPAEDTATPATSTLPESSTTSTAATPPIQPPETAPAGLSLVHIIGTKYRDYFTDGTTTVSFPGDPNIDGNLDKPNAPIPTHDGLTWDHTTGGYQYDTPSGDLELGEYAVQPSGSYIENAPPFISSTSTPAQLSVQTADSASANTSSSTTSTVSASVTDTSTSTAAAPSDSSADAATSPEPTTSPGL